MKRKQTALLALLVSCLGCLDFAPDSGTASVNARSENGLCPSRKTGSGLAGAPCFTYEDCAEVCCNCPSKGELAAAACVNGTCATQSGTCDRGIENFPHLCR